MRLAEPARAGEMAGHWFVGYTRPRQEDRAVENLVRQGFECRMPVIRAQRREPRGIVWQPQAMFPRYVFLRPAPGGASLDRVRSTFGMNDLVRFAGLPATLADAAVEELMEAGRRRCEALFRPGDPVRIVSGPLAGLEGVFDKAKGEERAIVLLAFLQREQRVLVAAGALARAH